MSPDPDPSQPNSADAKASSPSASVNNGSVFDPEESMADTSARPAPSSGNGPAPLGSTSAASIPSPSSVAPPLLSRDAYNETGRSLLSPPAQPSAYTIVMLVAIAIIIVGLAFDSFWIGLVGIAVALLLSLRVLWSSIRLIITEQLTEQQRLILMALLGLGAATTAVLRFLGTRLGLQAWWLNLNWDAIGALGEVFGALGQILIAILALWVAWRQYVIEKDLTTQQNMITQQQTIDSYFQGISELVLDAEGLLEDWPQERAIAEGRTAAILSSVNANGKAKVIRFLSRSRLLSPLKRDRHLGRAILDGMGGYQEDRDFGIRVIDLGIMLAGSNLAGTDLRWTDLSDVNLIRANLAYCDLVKANLARTILFDACLAGADLMGARLFYGSVEQATPRSKSDVPDYSTGEFTGAVVENADLRGVLRLSEEQRYYCCAWGGAKTRATIPGGCDGIPNKLGR